MDVSVKLSEKDTQKVLKRASSILHPDEQILFLGQCLNIRPMLSHFVITSSRILGFEQDSLTFSHGAQDIERLELDASKGRVELTLVGGSSITIKSIPQVDMAKVERRLNELRSPNSASSSHDVGLPPPSGPPVVTVAAANALSANGTTRLCGKELSAAARRALADVSNPDEVPWLVLNPGGATGALVAFEDRLAIIKAGAMTGFMAGSTFGSRQAVFYFRDITGIEFNSGLVTGVLEIQTSSYQGTANKDFWKGTLSSRNADSNDPFTLSNTLPMGKTEFRDCSEHIAELRKRIAASKQTVVIQQSDGSGFADQLAKLAALHAEGVLSAEEFAAAKQRLISG